MRKHKERKCIALSCLVTFSLKLPTFQSTTTLQRCKLIYAFEGGLRGFGGTAACTILISSRTMSVQSRAISHTLPERTPFIILLPLRKNKRARKVGKLSFFRLRQLHHIHTLNIWNSMLKLRGGRRPPCNPCRGRSGYEKFTVCRLKFPLLRMKEIFVAYERH